MICVTPDVWAAVGSGYAWRGKSRLDGVSLDDDRSLLQFGASLSFRVAKNQALRIAYGRGDTFVDVGSDGQSLLISWSLFL